MMPTVTQVTMSADGKYNVARKSLHTTLQHMTSNTPTTRTINPQVTQQYLLTCFYLLNHFYLCSWWGKHEWFTWLTSYYYYYTETQALLLEKYDNH